MRNLSVKITANYPGSVENTKSVNIKTKGFNPELASFIEGSEEFKRFINRFFYHPVIVTTENYSSFYLYIDIVTSSKSFKDIKIKIKTNIHDIFNDPIEKPAVNELLINVQNIIKQILKLNKPIKISNFIPVPRYIEIYDAKKLKILKETLEIKGEKATALHLGELSISKNEYTFCIETSIFEVKNIATITSIIRSFDKSFRKLSSEETIMNILKFIKDTPEILFLTPDEIKEFEIITFAPDEDNDLNLITYHTNPKIVKYLVSQEAIEETIDSIYKNELSSLRILTLTPIFESVLKAL